MINPSYFAGLAESQNLQFLIDSTALNLEQQSIWRNWLNLGIPQMSLSFDAAIGRERIAAAASIVDTDAPAPLRSRNKAEIYKGKIPAIKEKFRMNQDDMRNLEVIKALNLAGGNNAALVNFLYNDLAEAAVSGDKRVDLMLLQGVSNLSIDISTTNNPDGVAYGELDLLAADYQKQGVPVVWSNAANSTPIDDIDGFITLMRDTRGRTYDRIVMSGKLWSQFKKSAQVKTYLASFFNTGRANSAFAPTQVAINEYMVENGLPTIEIINHSTHIEVDGKPTFVKGFNENNVAFLPAGKVGTLMNAVSMEEIHRVAGKNYAKFGPTLVSKWSEPDPLVEFTGMEMLAFPAINVDAIAILKTDTVQASFI